MKMKFTFVVTPNQILRQKFLLALFDRLAARRQTELNLFADCPRPPQQPPPQLSPGKETASEIRSQFSSKPTDHRFPVDGNLWLRQERKLLTCRDNCSGGGERIVILRALDRIMRAAAVRRPEEDARVETDGRQIFNRAMASNFVRFLYRRTNSRQHYFLGIDSLPWLLCFLGWGHLTESAPASLNRLPPDFFHRPDRAGLSRLERAGWEFFNERRVAHMECLFLDFPRYRFSRRQIQFPSIKPDSFRRHFLWFAKGEISLRLENEIFEQCAGVYAGKGDGRLDYSF